MPTSDDDYWLDPTPWMMGYASILPVEQENDLVRQLRDVVAEVTGKPVDEPIKQRIGFLP